MSERLLESGAREFALESPKRQTNLASFGRLDNQVDTWSQSGFLLLADGVSYLLLADGTSKLLMNTPVKSWILE